MRVGDAVAEILKLEGLETIIGYPVNHVLEHAAIADIRPIIVRQERTGIHMADAISRLSSGRGIGVFVMQLGPGRENSYRPILIRADPGDAGRHPRRLAHIEKFAKPRAPPVVGILFRRVCTAALHLNGAT